MDEIRDAARYNYLRDRDLDTIANGGIFAGMTPKNVILNGVDLDDAIDKAMGLQPLPVWTVLLRQPEYVGIEAGTHLLTVTAESAEVAVDDARREAYETDFDADERAEGIGSADDYMPLLVIRGRHEDVKP